MGLSASVHGVPISVERLTLTVGGTPQLILNGVRYDHFIVRTDEDGNCHIEVFNVPAHEANAHRAISDLIAAYRT